MLTLDEVIKNKLNIIKNEQYTRIKLIRYYLFNYENKNNLKYYLMNNKDNNHIFDNQYLQYKLTDSIECNDETLYNEYAFEKDYENEKLYGNYNDWDSIYG